MSIVYLNISNFYWRKIRLFDQRIEAEVRDIEVRGIEVRGIEALALPTVCGICRWQGTRSRGGQWSRASRQLVDEGDSPGTRDMRSHGSRIQDRDGEEGALGSQPDRYLFRPHTGEWPGTRWWPCPGSRCAGTGSWWPSVSGRRASTLWNKRNMFYFGAHVQELFHTYKLYANW